jgi:hypothetical protein
MHRSDLTAVVRSANRIPRHSARRLRGAACLVLSLAIAGSASAQSNPRQLADANKSAMEQYNNLDIETAKANLERAIKSAERNGIRGPWLARSYANLAVVLVGGLGDQPGAVELFEKALAEDPSVEPDPIVATPEVMQAFAIAKKNAPAQAVIDEDLPAPAKRRGAGVAEGNLKHTPTAEQLAQTAVPVFVSRDDALGIAKIKIAYRSTGMPKPRSTTMNEGPEGYSFLIPCSDVFEPEVEYFLVAVDSAGKEVGRFGSPDSPVSVPIVSVRTQEAPALPGEAPPTQCTSSSEEACTPGTPGCEQHGNAGLGESCYTDSDCGESLICEDDFCAIGERTQAQESASRRRTKNDFYFDVGVGVALTAVNDGRSPDRKLTRAVLNDVQNASLVNGAVSGDRAKQELTARGWDCSPTVGDNGQVTARNCTVAVNPGGVVALPVFNVASGYFVTPRFALALTGRFQVGRGKGPMAGVTIGGRGEYYLTEPKDEGFKLGLLAGVSVGQLQARPPADGSRQGPFATNANVNGVGGVINAGARMAYMFVPGFGLQVTPLLNFGLPNFLLSVDIVAGISTAF